MEVNLEHYLKKFYDKLYDNLVMKKKLKNSSVLISFLEIKSNVRFRLLSESSIPCFKIPREALTNLLTRRLIRGTDEIDNYTITARGVWEYENGKNIIDEVFLIKYLDKKFFGFEDSQKSLSDKEKIILFSMIAARTFSKKSPIDLKKDETTNNIWQDILYNASEKLKSLDIISEKNQKEFHGKLYAPKGNEHPVSNIIRHSDQLPKKTKGLYKAPGEQKYYLDIYKDSKISKENLSYLFWLIFDDKLSDTVIEEVVNFCREIAYDKNIYIFNLQEHIFSRPEYDDIIRDSIRDSIISKKKWEIA